jgi:CRP/FNR family transcriptional regulator
MKMQSMGDLVSFEPYGRLSTGARTLLNQGVVRKRVLGGASLMHKGEPVPGAFVVLAGALRVYTVTPAGAEATLYRVDAGETCVLSLNCLFNDLLYPAWVQAAGDTRVALIPGPLYRQLFTTEPAIQEVTVRALSTLVFRLMAELEAIHSCTHRQRLAHYILHHASSEGVVAATQQQLAGHLGTSREVIGRLMQALAKEGLVKTHRGRIAIKDLFGLRKLSGAKSA